MRRAPETAGERMAPPLRIAALRDAVQYGGRQSFALLRFGAGNGNTARPVDGACCGLNGEAQHGGPMLGRPLRGSVALDMLKPDEPSSAAEKKGDACG